MDAASSMRTFNRVVAGQLWRSSDPRRLSAFRIIDVIGALAFLGPVYPARGPRRFVRLGAFRVTGSKGYTLLEDAP